MKKSNFLLIFLFSVQLVFAQKATLNFSNGMKAEMKEKIKAAVLHTWPDYNAHTWGADDLSPLTKQPKTLTKDQQYLFMAKRMTDDILKHSRTDASFASLKDVRTFEKENSMHSFLFAETFKYAYLVFAEDKLVDLKKTVFTTEAHLFKIVK